MSSLGVNKAIEDELHTNNGNCSFTGKKTSANSTEDATQIHFLSVPFESRPTENLTEQVVPMRTVAEKGDEEEDEAKKTNGVSTRERKSSMLILGKKILVRDRWSKKADFLLSVIGFAVDLANVWRFPYLCYKNGGGAFLVPYTLMLVFGGIPLFYMELALGQYIRKGAITSWGKICPLLKGVGYSVVLVAFYTDWFYNMIIAWSLYYFGISFNTKLPWMFCGNEWNTPNCTDTHLSMNVAQFNWSAASVTSRGNVTFPVEEFFNNRVLGRTMETNLETPGQIQWPVLLCFCAVMVICYFSLWKGIHTSGKVVWFTAIFPYVVLLILLIRGLTLDGAVDGIRYYIVPKAEKLKSAEPWVDAATQVFFSLGPGFGVLMAYASYNEFHNNVYRDALVVATINSLTSLLSGFVVFSMLGYMAFRRGLLVSDVIQDDPVLVFSVYPEALSTLPGSVFWSIVFFLMLLTLGLDSSFGGSEAVITALSDEYPILAHHRELFVLGLFSFYCLIGALESTQGGIYWFHLFERMCVEYPILLAVFCETVCISWIYGIDRFRDNVHEMLGFRPGWFWRITWKFLAPVFIMFNIVYGLSTYQNLQLGDYVYPTWANALGWILSGTSMLAIPVVAVYQICRTPGSFIERLRILTTPCPSLLPGQQSTELKPDVVLKVPKSISINMVLIGDLNHEKPLLRHTQSDPNVNQGNEKSDTVQDKETVNEQDR